METLMPNCMVARMTLAFLDESEEDGYRMFLSYEDALQWALSDTDVQWKQQIIIYDAPAILRRPYGRPVGRPRKNSVVDATSVYQIDDSERMRDNVQKLTIRQLQTLIERSKLISGGRFHITTSSDPKWLPPGRY